MEGQVGHDGKEQRRKFSEMYSLSLSIEDNIACNVKLLEHLDQWRLKVSCQLRVMLE